MLARLHPPEMQDAQRRDDVDQPVQPLPALATKALDHAIRARHGQRNEQDKGNKTHRDERALEHILPHFLHIKKVIEP